MNDWCKLSGKPIGHRITASGVPLKCPECGAKVTPVSRATEPDVPIYPGHLAEEVYEDVQFRVPKSILGARHDFVTFNEIAPIDWELVNRLASELRDGAAERLRASGQSNANSFWGPGVSGLVRRG